MQGLRRAFDEEYANAGFTWGEVKAALNGVFDHLHIYVINSSSDEVLDYAKYEREGVGLTAIAVGGLSLSRGFSGRLRESYIVSTDTDLNDRNFDLISEHWRNGFGGRSEEPINVSSLFVQRAKPSNAPPSWPVVAVDR